MTLLEILYSVQHIAQILAKPLEMSLEQYNGLLRIASDELFKEMSYGYLQGNGAEVDSRVSRALLPFKWNVAPTLTDDIKYGVSGQRFSILNSDLWLSAWVANNATDYPDKVINVDIVTAQEGIERLSNSITHPSSTHPILMFDKSVSGTTMYGYIIPGGWTALNGFILRRPSTPNLIITNTDGVNTQHAGSTLLEWDDVYHVDIIRKILQYLGISIGNEFITSAIEQQKNNEK